MPANDKDFRRNFSLGVINGTFFNGALAFLSGSTVIPVFISQLTDSKILIGLFSTLESFGWFAPQLFTALFIAHRDKVLGFYNNLSFARLFFFGIATATVFIFSQNHSLILLSFAISFTIYAIASGIAGIAFTEIVGKTIPVNKRGSYFGLRMFLGGSIAAIEGIAVTKILEVYPYPQNFGILFIAAWVMMFFGLLVFAYIKEPSAKERLPKAPPVMHLKEALKIYTNDSNFRRLFWSRAWVNTYYMATPFYIVFAIDRLDAPNWIAGTYLAAQMVGFLSTNLLWAWLSNKVSNRLVIIIAGLISVLPPLLAFIGYFISINYLHFSVVFFLIGMAEAGIGMGYISYLLEIAHEKGRLLSIGVMNTFLAPTVFFSALGGLLAQIFSLRILFVIVFITTAMSLSISIKLKETRNR